MRIAWFTPFSEQSAIGMVSRNICEELARSHSVEIWTHDSDNLIDTSVTVKHFTAADKLSELEGYDHIVYNIGNYAGNHRDIYDVSQRYSGVVICHDQNMGGFWGQYFTFPEYGGDPAGGFERYVAFCREYYGTAGEKEATEAWQSGHYPIYDYKNMPSYHFIEPIVKNARGVFSHARFFIEEIKSFYNGPVGYSYLPCKAEKVKGYMGDELSEIIGKARKAGKLIAVSNGIVHPVKQIDKVTQALVDEPELAKKIVYIVIGGYGGDYGNNLKQLSETTLKGCLYMMNYQPYNVMNGALENADFCINLRYPNSEVCSLSLLEQMSYSKPVLVINSGVYGEMPDDAVIKLNYSSISAELKSVLEKLVSDKSSFDSYAVNAGKFIAENCTVKAYCKKILDFLNSIGVCEEVTRLQNLVISDTFGKLQSLGFTNQTVPATMNTVVNGLEHIFNVPKAGKRSLKTIGVWAAFDTPIPNLNREGISRFMSYMIATMVRNYDVDAEVWCYSFNEDEVKKIFSAISPEKLHIVTEKNWAEMFGARADVVQRVGVIKETIDNLNSAAREVSRADIMLPLIVYLDSVIGTDKPVFVPVHDMAVAYHFNDFIAKDTSYKARQADILARAENLSRNGAVFFSNCNTVREKQVLHYIKSLKKEKTDFIYLPVNIPENIEKHFVSEKKIREKFGINGRYLFYPTQVRPYKNISIIIKALALIANKYKDLSLVLTGNPEDVPEVNMLIDKLKVRDKIILLNSVSEYDLYSIYKYADATPVSSLFEGGLPWQASEALYIGTPIVLTDIDIVRERISACGYTADNCGLRLFDPHNENELADRLRCVLDNRQKAVREQQPFADKLLSYTWDDAAREYYRIFTEMQ